MKKGFVSIDNNVFETFLAISNLEQENGLMGYYWPPPIMSFIYKYAKVNNFWMKNTPSPLDIVFSYKGVITQICRGKPYCTDIIGERSLSDLVVEFPKGTVEIAGIKLGQKISLINGKFIKDFCTK